MAVNDARLNSILDKATSSLQIDASGILGLGRVIGLNDYNNNGQVRIYPLNNSSADFRYIEDNHVEEFLFAEVMKPAAGENHGFFYQPQFGDFVIYTSLNGKNFILGSINNPSWQYASANMPAEAQNIQSNSFEYNSTHWPDLTKKGYHLKDPKIGDKFHPSSFLMRYRKNDFLIYNATKVNDNPASAIKLMELRSSENQLFQIVDLGNFGINPGEKGNNSKKYSPVRQTDYRDLWEGFNINREFWTERTDKPALSNESQFIKIATNGNNLKETPHSDTGKDLPALSRGDTRTDDRQLDGSQETSKSFSPVWQTLKVAKGDDRYFQDKEPGADWSASVQYRYKVKKWIENVSGAYLPENKHFNVGHHITLSNTIYKRRAMISTKKGHQLVLSDIDKDEKILLNSHRGKFLYMEDSDPGHYDAMWFASQSHHMIFCDHMQAPFLIDDKGKERHKLVDPNQGSMSSYQLIQTGKYQKIWLADSPLTPRIHVHTTTGHEMLLLDHDNGKAGISPIKNKGKIQITTNDKKMQITLDVEKGDITIQNHNLGGNGKTGDISIYAAKNIKLHAKEMIQMRANKGYDIQSSDGSYKVVACGISHDTPCGSPAVPEVIRPTVLTNIETTEGSLINKFDPS